MLPPGCEHVKLKCPLPLLAPFKWPALRLPKNFQGCGDLEEDEMVPKLLEAMAEAVGSNQGWAGEVGELSARLRRI
jgi:hypothetical protein